MNIVKTVFYFLEAIAVISAVGILLTRKVFYGALFLVVCLLSLAGIYVIASAEFVAVTQILVYVGGILVLIIFGILVTSRGVGNSSPSENRHWLTGLIPGIISAIGLITLFTVYTRTSNTVVTGSDTLQTIGILFLTDYLIQFEIAGVLLLVALIGATVTSSFAEQQEV